MWSWSKVSRMARTRWAAVSRVSGRDSGAVSDASSAGIVSAAGNVAVMHLGQLAEFSPADELYAHPRHPYTRALLDSVPVLDVVTGAVRRPRPLQGEPPSPLHPPSGCRFRTRCPIAQDVCATVEPALRDTGDGQFASCHFPLGVDAPRHAGVGAAA